MEDADMRTLTVNTFVTLDGVMQAPGGPEEDPTGGFEAGGWSVNYWDDMMGGVMGEAMAKPFDLLLGRKTYEIFAAHWPYAKDEPAGDGDVLDRTAFSVVRTMNETTKYVASRTLKSPLAWQNSRLLEGDAAQAIARLKGEDGPDIQVHGSSGLMQTLLAADLVDLFRLWVFPVVVGKGKRLFGAGTHAAGLTLVDSRASTTGVVISTYRPAGALRSGSFQLVEPTSAEVERRRKMVEEG
jgi:dihydrofolate reductase